MQHEYGMAPGTAGAATDPGVAMAQWRGSTPGAGQAVGTFAVVHGMPAAAREPLESVVSEVVRACACRVSTADTTVEAATDGTWLTVRVSGARRWDRARLHGRLPLAAGLADRIELAPSAGGDGTSVLLEIAMST